MRSSGTFRMAVLAAAVVGGAVAQARQGAAAPEPPAARGDEDTGITVPARTPSGDRLVVSDEHARLGTVYHVVARAEPAVRFVSDSGLEKFEGTSPGPAGYIVLRPARPTRELPDAPPALTAGAFRLSAASMKTGLALRDEHMLGEGWLDAERFPDITFVLTESRDLRLVERSEGLTRWSLTMIGELTVRGVRQRITIESAELRLMEASAATTSVAPGDLMTLTCRYDVRLRDFGIDATVLGVAVAERIRIEQTLLLSTR